MTLGSLLLKESEVALEEGGNLIQEFDEGVAQVAGCSRFRVEFLFSRSGM